MNRFQLVRNFIRAEITGSPEHRHRIINHLLGRATSKRIASLLRELNVSVVFDIGAFRGEWSRSLIDLSERELDIYLFEPNEAHRAELLTIGGTVYTVALSDTEREVPFLMSGRTGDSYYKEDSGRYASTPTLSIRTQTLDGIVARDSIPLPQFIKIDTQGSELDILTGGADCLRGCSLLLIEIPLVPYNLGAPAASAYFYKLQKSGFVPIEVGEIHQSHGLAVQIDILFMQKSAFSVLHPESRSFSFLGDADGELKP